MPAAELDVPADPRYVGVARRFARETLTTWDCEDLVSSAELVVSELVSNGVLHARSELRLRLEQEDAGVLIEVVDASLRAPQQRHYSATATTGRGLALVAALSHGDWGTRSTETGKVVWARITAGGEEQVPDLDLFSDLDDLVGDDVAGHDDPSVPGGGPPTGGSRPGRPTASAVLDLAA